VTKRVMHPRLVNKKFADAFGMENLSPSELRSEMKRLGYSPNTGLFKKLLKSRGKSNFKDGGLAMAIDKVKAKGMKLGGEAKPLVGGQKKLDKNKDGRISGDDFAMMEVGGKVEEYGSGGKVKGGKMSCRGMGAAVKGGGYTIS